MSPRIMAGHLADAVPQCGRRHAMAKRESIARPDDQKGHGRRNREQWRKSLPRLQNLVPTWARHRSIPNQSDGNAGWKKSEDRELRKNCESAAHSEDGGMGLGRLLDQNACGEE